MYSLMYFDDVLLNFEMLPDGRVTGISNIREGVNFQFHIFSLNKVPTAKEVELFLKSRVLGDRRNYKLIFGKPREMVTLLEELAKTKFCDPDDALWVRGIEENLTYGELLEQGGMVA